MKILLISLIALGLVFGMALAQSPQYPSWPGGIGNPNQLKKIPMYCTTEGDYVVRNIGTANDTSAAIVVPPFDEMWLLTKVVSDSTDDSVDVVVWVQGKFTDELVTGYTARSVDWFNIDSSLVTTADTVGGRVKKLSIPYAVDQIRVVWDGVTGNEAEVGNQESSWIILKF